MDDRPAHCEDEIDVTPEMIEAGALAYLEHDPRFEGTDAAAIRVYRAMAAAGCHRGLGEHREY